MGTSVEHDEFLRKVEQDQGNPYPGIKFPKGVGVGLLLLIVSYIILGIAPINEGISLYITTAVVLLFPMSLVVAAWSVTQTTRLMNRAQFMGLSPGIWTSVLLYLDMKIQGIEKLGLIHSGTKLPLDVRVPDQFGALSLSRVFASINADYARGSYTMDPYAEQPDLGTPLCFSCVFGIAFLLNIVMLALAFVMGPVQMTTFAGLFTIVTGIVFFWSVGSFRRQSSAERALRGIELPIEEIEKTMDYQSFMMRVLDTYRTGHHSPLMVLVIGDYQELTYTTRTVVTSEGIEVKFAVLFPRH